MSIKLCRKEMCLNHLKLRYYHVALILVIGTLLSGIADASPFRVYEGVGTNIIGQYQYLKVISLSRMLTVDNMKVNDGNCHIPPIRRNFYFCGGQMCDKRVPMFPINLAYGKSIKIPVRCTAYKAKIKTNKGTYVVHFRP